MRSFHGRDECQWKKARVRVMKQIKVTPYFATITGVDVLFAPKFDKDSFTMKQGTLKLC